MSLTTTHQPPADMEHVAPGLWTLAFPLKMLGVNFGRVVTVMRLESGDLIVHSTAPFTGEHVAWIHSLGHPAWLVDALLRHDTFAAAGVRAFPHARYLAPAGFAKVAGAEPELLTDPPAEWSREIAVAEIAGAPEFGEIVLLHKPSRCLVVTDLVVNFEAPAGIWERLLLGMGCVGGRCAPGFTRPYKRAVTDPEAFRRSIAKIMAWDFDRIIVGHGRMIRADGKRKLAETLRHAGFPAFH